MTDDDVLPAYAWNLSYARELTLDLTPQQWTHHGGPGLENHATWTIGHLVTGSDILAEDLGLERTVSAEWRAMFERRGPGDQRLPSHTVSDYPPGEEVFAELARQHARVAERWRSMSAAELATPLAWRFSRYFPTLRGAALFLAITHEASHLGQLAAWRRHLGLPSALGRMARGGE